MPQVFTLSQIIEQIRDGDGDDIYSRWTKSAVTYSTNIPSFFYFEGAGFLPMSGALETTAARAFELWDDLIAINLGPSLANIGEISLNYSTTAGGAFNFPTTSGQIGDTASLQRSEIWIE